MTSNQLNYWRNQEEIRANKAREAENLRSNLAKEAETHRHNLTDEQLKAVQNQLEEMGLKLKDKQQLLDIADLYGKYGFVALNQLPPEARDKIYSAFGIPIDGADVSSGVSSWWEGVLEAISALGGGKGIAALF